jgi:hypothetical protein
MRSIRTLFCLLTMSVLVAVPLAAQQKPAAPDDPRIGLKPGFKDAGVAVRHLELVKSLPKAEGFFDPKSPAGIPTAPERQQNAAATPPTPTAATPAAATPAAAAPATPAPPSGLDFANSDLAFSADHLFIGNFHGFNAYNIEEPAKARLLASVVCPGGQGDVSVYGKLLFMSVEQTRGRVDCGTKGVAETVSAERFRGVRIFDISDARKPKQIAAVQTCKGSHTHTLVVNPKDKANVYIYGSGTGQVRAAEELAGCSGGDADKDPNTALFSIDVIQVPLAAPQTAKVVNRPRIFSDPVTGNIAGLWQGGNYGPGTQTSNITRACHDITVYPELGLAGGACGGNGILLDISDPVHPTRLDHVGDKNFAYWHSATFNNDGTKLLFSDEWGGGTRPRCRAGDPLNWGADAIFEIVDRKLKFASYYKMPAPQTEQENCVAHNGSLIPVPGRDIMVQAWYQGGLSVFDFTDAANPVEIAFFDRGPIDAKDLYTGGYWSTYWYNGHIYGSEIARGVDVFKLLPSEYLSQSEIEAALVAQTSELNVQQQQKFVWPSNAVVARAYVDQLSRSKAIPADRARAVSDAMTRAEKLRSGRDRGAKEIVAELDTLAAQLDRDAGTATGRDAMRLRSLASIIKERTAKLR